jgi:methyl-accepting chemotaxis protein
MLKDLSIKKSLSLFVGVVAVIFVIVGAISYRTSSQFSSTLADAASNTSLLNASGSAAASLDGIRADVLGFIIAFERGDLEWMAQIEKRYADHQKRLNVALSELEKSNPSPSVKSIITDMLPPARAFAKDSGEMFSTARTDLTAVVTKMFDFEKRFTVASTKAVALSSLIEKENLAFQESARNETLAAAALVTGAVVVGLLALAGIAWWAQRQISKPILQVLAATEDLRAGEADLTKKLPAMSGEFGQVAVSLNGFVGQLHNLVAQVAINADEIANAARQISVGNTDLSARTEEQASTLEETASSMEEFTSSIRQNAENTKLANGLALSAQDAAEKGGRVASRAVEKITAVNASSRKIGEIIGTIDSIAFQTNILALNAAVEAARAGDQGRGFAVVAGEVRALAQRSAAAAKEIKDLIGATVDQVGEGTRLVNEAGTAMNNIVVAIQQVTEIINEISTASHEQASGIEQVNRAITQMEGVTQQNAALVEEAAAAAEAMRDQAEGMASLVSRFKLDESGLREEAKRARRAQALSEPPGGRLTQQARDDAKPAPALPKSVDGDWEEF